MGRAHILGSWSDGQAESWVAQSAILRGRVGRRHCPCVAVANGCATAELPGYRWSHQHAQHRAVCHRSVGDDCVGGCEARQCPVPTAEPTGSLSLGVCAPAALVESFTPGVFIVFFCLPARIFRHYVNIGSIRPWREEGKVSITYRLRSRWLASPRRLLWWPPASLERPRMPNKIKSPESC